MRTGTCLAALAVGLLLAGQAPAQRVLGFGGVNPTQIVNKPVEIPDSAIPIAQPQTRSVTGFSLMNILSKFQFPSAKPVHGQSIFPTPAGMPGKNYLKAFGFSRPAPVEP